MSKEQTKQTNPDGTVTVSIGSTLKELERVAKAEKRSMSKQVVVIIHEWLEARKANRANYRAESSARQLAK